MKQSRVSTKPIIIINAAVAAALAAFSLLLIIIAYSPSIFGLRFMSAPPDALNGGSEAEVIAVADRTDLAESDLVLLNVGGESQIKEVISVDGKFITCDAVDIAKRTTDTISVVTLDGDDGYDGKVVYRSELLGGLMGWALSFGGNKIIIIGTALVLLLALSVWYVARLQKARSGHDAAGSLTAGANTPPDAAVRKRLSPRHTAPQMMIMPEEMEVPAVRHIEANPVQRDDVSPKKAQNERLVQEEYAEEIFHQTYHEFMTVSKVEEVKKDDTVHIAPPKPVYNSELDVSMESLMEALNSFLPDENDEWDEDLKIYHAKAEKKNSDFPQDDLI